MKIYDNANKELMKVSSISRDGDILVVKGKIFGTMPMTAKLSPAEARSAIKLLDLKMVLFLISFLFRKGQAEPVKKP
jgi:hypothetical protein